MGMAPMAPMARRRLALLSVRIERAIGCAIPMAEVWQIKP